MTAYDLRCWRLSQKPMTRRLLRRHLLAIVAPLASIACDREEPLRVSIDVSPEGLVFSASPCKGGPPQIVHEIGVYEGAAKQTTCELALVVPPARPPAVARWAYGSHHAGYARQGGCVPLEVGRDYQANAENGVHSFGFQRFRMRQGGSVELLKPNSCD